MVVNIEDLRSDSWAGIVRTIRRGEHPEVAHLEAAFRRGEQRALPVEVQTYLADLLGGKLQYRKGRPPKRRTQPLMEHPIIGSFIFERWLTSRVERLTRRYRFQKEGHPQQLAFETIAKKKSWGSWTTAQTRYREAKLKLLLQEKGVKRKSGSTLETILFIGGDSHGFSMQVAKDCEFVDRPRKTGNKIETYQRCSIEFPDGHICEFFASTNLSHHEIKVAWDIYQRR